MTLLTLSVAAAAVQEAGFTSLFNGKDLTGWKVPAGDNGHWKVVDGVIDYDAESEAPANDKSLWSEREFANFVLRVDWRIEHAVSILACRSPFERSPQEGRRRQGNSEWRAGLGFGYLPPRNSKAQVNIWGWPIGSGEVYGYPDGRQDAARGPRRGYAEAHRRS